jgi:ketosteroid isomerase-like protein
MKKIISLTICLMAVISVAEAQGDVRYAEQRRFEAQIARDTAALAELLSDKLVYVHSNALQESKADFIRSVGSGGIRYLSMEKIAERDYVKSGHFVFITGIVAVSGLYQGTPFSMTLRYSSYYRKEAGEWRLYYWQSTKIP